jgi:hypothetical protein
VKTYADHRIALAGMMRASAMDGSKATTDLTQEELARLRPHMANLQSLIGPMIARSKQDRDQALEVFNLIKGFCSKKFSDDLPNMEVDANALAH